CSGYIQFTATAYYVDGLTQFDIMQPQGRFRKGASPTAGRLPSLPVVGDPEDKKKYKTDTDTYVKGLLGDATGIPHNIKVKWDKTGKTTVEDYTPKFKKE